MGRSRKRGIRGGGTVFQRKDGRWEAKFKVEETGKYKSLYADTEKEAYKKLEEAKFQQRQGTLATGPQQTVKQFLEHWLEDVEKPTVRLSTYVNNRVVVYKHLIPALGHIQLQKLTARQLQSFYTKKLKEGTSASRVVRFNAVLHKALKHAKRMKLVGSNVSEDVELPAPSSSDPRFLTDEQARAFVQRAKEHRLQALVILAITTALRKGEILALRWSGIDFERGILRVHSTLNYIGRYGFVEGKPKTAKSEREVAVPSFTLEALKLHRARQLEQRLKAGALWVDRDLVFCDKHGNFIIPMTLWHQFNRLLQEVGAPRIRFHDLRHSAATLLLSMGVPDRVVQEILGHTTNAQTNKYIHVSRSMQRDAMRKMDEFFNG
jgi:integrase